MTMSRLMVVTSVVVDLSLKACVSSGAFSVLARGIYLVSERSERKTREGAHLLGKRHAVRALDPRHAADKVSVQ